MQATDIDDVLVKLTGIIDSHRDLRQPARVLSGGLSRHDRPRASWHPERQLRRRRSHGAVGHHVRQPLPGGARRLSLGGGGASARAWQVAFDAAARQHTMILQHVLLGMNAHINFDLPLAVIAAANGGKIADLEEDFKAINRILADVARPRAGDHRSLLTALEHSGSGRRSHRRETGDVLDQHRSRRGVARGHALGR